MSTKNLSRLSNNEIYLLRLEYGLSNIPVTDSTRKVLIPRLAAAITANRRRSDQVPTQADEGDLGADQDKVQGSVEMQEFRPLPRHDPTQRTPQQRTDTQGRRRNQAEPMQLHELGQVTATSSEHDPVEMIRLAEREAQVAIAARTAAEETLRQREEEINQLGQQWLQREQHLIHERDEARGWLAEILETSLRNQAQILATVPELAAVLDRFLCSQLQVGQAQQQQPPPHDH